MSFDDPYDRERPRRSHDHWDLDPSNQPDPQPIAGTVRCRECSEDEHFDDLEELAGKIADLDSEWCELNEERDPRWNVWLGTHTRCKEPSEDQLAGGAGGGWSSSGFAQRQLDAQRLKR